ncbi:hypothetical protein LTR85_003202 [Meristemomyces frigidus]|nr:hypothetical protein LTR85_003202 [Meristemomyces frigidus]
MPPKAKANTKAKVTKPAPAAKVAATTKKATVPKRAAATKKTTAPAPAPAAPAKKAAPIKKAPAAKAPAKKATEAAASTSTTTKRKRGEEDDAPVPAKKAKAVASTRTTTKRTTKATPAPVAAPAPTKKAPVKKSAPVRKAAAAKNEPAEKATKAAASTTTTTKRKRDDSDAPAPTAAPAKKAAKAKLMKKGAVINEPPTQRLHVYVFGEGTAGELGLGTAKNAIDVKRPRLNPNLAADKVGITQIVAGGMHVIALTHDNKILTWGVNDQGALGRDTQWEGGLKDMDAAGEDSDSEDDDDNGLNPRESIPAEVDFSTTEVAEGTRWVQVAAGDSCSFALTDDGRVYGWGTFRGNEGIFGFNAETEIAQRPLLLPDLKKITAIAVGANHALALDSTGSVFAWGSGQQNQLGRRVVERTKIEGLKPREFGLPKGAKNGIAGIETGSYHSFAISKNGDIYSWGLNNFGETGIPDNAGQDDAVILKPQVVESLRGKNVTSIMGGGHHSLAATANGDCLIWGRIDGHQIGIADEDIAKMPEDIVMRDEKGDPRIVMVPTKVTAITGAVTQVATSSDHNIVVTKEGKAWSWGFSANYQTGQGQVDDVLVATMIDNTAVREKKLTGATTGGQFSILTAEA